MFNLIAEFRLFCSIPSVMSLII